MKPVLQTNRTPALFNDVRYRFLRGPKLALHTCFTIEIQVTLFNVACFGRIEPRWLVNDDYIVRTLLFVRQHELLPNSRLIGEARETVHRNRCRVFGLCQQHCPRDGLA